MLTKLINLLLIVYLAPSNLNAHDVMAYSNTETLITVDSIPDPLQAGWEGGEVCQLLEENDRFRTLKCTFPPGGGHDKHFHAPHFGYALSGSTFRIEDESGVREVQLKSGSHFSSEGVKWHSVENIGDSTSVYLIFEPKQR